MLLLVVQLHRFLHLLDRRFTRVPVLVFQQVLGRRREYPRDKGRMVAPFFGVAARLSAPWQRALPYAQRSHHVQACGRAEAAITADRADSLR